MHSTRAYNPEDNFAIHDTPSFETAFELSYRHAKCPVTMLALLLPQLLLYALALQRDPHRAFPICSETKFKCAPLCMQDFRPVLES